MTLNAAPTAGQPLGEGDSVRMVDAIARKIDIGPLEGSSAVPAPMVTVARLAVAIRPLVKLTTQQSHRVPSTCGSTLDMEMLLYRAAYDLHAARVTSVTLYLENSEDPLARLY